MEKCVLEHCELQWGGQCCLVCPKGLNKPNPRREAADKIDKCITMLRCLKMKLPKDRACGLPNGVYREHGTFIATVKIGSNRKRLCACGTPEEAMEICADAEEALEKGEFAEWFADFKAKQKSSKKGK